MAGHLRRRGPRTWAVVIELPRVDGKRRQAWHTVHGTKREAEAELTRLLRERDTHTYAAAGKVTVGEHLERWLEEVIRTRREPTTYDLYARILRRHLLPALGSVLLRELDARHLERYYAGQEHLSGSTLNLHHILLHSALKTAVRWKLIAVNPCSQVEPPRKGKGAGKAIDATAALRILDAAAGTRQYLPLLLAVHLGLRQGEILALRWEDVDLEAGTLEVRHTLQRRAAGGLVLGTPKTEAARRRLPLGATLLEALRRERARQAELRLALGPAWEHHNLLCPGEFGGFWHPSSHRAGYRALLLRHDLPAIRFHDLRHSHATILLRERTPLQVVSERLGHARSSITSDIYAHVLPGQQAEATETMERALKRKSAGE